MQAKICDLSASTVIKKAMERLPYSLFQTMVVALLLSGCGAAQLGTCAPHTKEEGTPTRNWVECFDRPFSHQGMTHSVFCLNDGTDKPPVLLLHELTGLSPGTLAYAEELSNDFTVYVPLLFGEKGKFSLTKGLAAYWFQGSMEFFPGGEWGLPAEGSAPIVDWLRDVVRKVGERHTQQRIGIIGNCLTGPFPLALLNHPRVNAAVVAQPSLPLPFWWHTDAARQSLGLSADDLQYARKSAAKIYGVRFETDCMSVPAKQKTLRDEFGDRYINGEIPANAYRTLEGKPAKAHSTLIGSWRAQGEVGRPSRDAREKVRDFLLKELNGIHPAG